MPHGRLSRNGSSHELCSELSPVCVELGASAVRGLDAAVGAMDNGGLPNDDGVRQPSLAQYFCFHAKRLAGLQGKSEASTSLCCHAAKSGGLGAESGISTVRFVLGPLNIAGTFRSIGDLAPTAIPKAVKFDEGLRSAASAVSSGGGRRTRIGESAGEGPTVMELGDAETHG